MMKALHPADKHNAKSLHQLFQHRAAPIPQLGDRPFIFLFPCPPKQYLFWPTEMHFSNVSIDIVVFVLTRINCFALQMQKGK